MSQDPFANRADVRERFIADIEALLASITPPRWSVGVRWRTDEVMADLMSTMTMQEIGDKYGVSRQRISQVVARLGVVRPKREKTPKPVKPPRALAHGRHGYQRRKCRCAACCAAWEAYKAERRAIVAARVVPEFAVHGRYTTYGNYGCRCAPCSAAHSEEMKRASRRRKLKKQCSQAVAPVSAAPVAGDAPVTEPTAPAASGSRGGAL